jgi:hypothetical protein
MFQKQSMMRKRLPSFKAQLRSCLNAIVDLFVLFLPPVIYLIIIILCHSFSNHAYPLLQLMYCMSSMTVESMAFAGKEGDCAYVDVRFLAESDRTKNANVAAVLQHFLFCFHAHRSRFYSSLRPTRSFLVMC